MIPRKTNVERGFSRAAAAYNHSANFQTECAPEFAEFIRALRPTPENILEAGCGTGNLTERLHTIFPQASIFATDLASGMVEFCKKRFLNKPEILFQKHDFDAPFPFHEMDMAVSSLSLQWSESLPCAFRNLANTLKNGAQIACSIPLNGSLESIRTIFESAGFVFPGLALPSPEEIQDAMKESFSELNFIRKTYRENYSSLRECLRTMRKNGTSGGGNGTPFPQMKKILQNTANISPFQVEYHVIFASGRKIK